MWILNNEQLATIENDIVDLENGLADRRLRKTKHFVSELIYKKFGKCEHLCDVFVGEKGERYVLEDFDTIVRDNYNHKRYKYVYLLYRRIRKNNKLDMRNVYKYELSLTKTDEKWVEGDNV